MSLTECHHRVPARWLCLSHWGRLGLPWLPVLAVMDDTAVTFLCSCMESAYQHRWTFARETAVLCRACGHARCPVRFSPEFSASQCHFGPQDSSTFKRINAFWGTISIIERTSLFNFNFYLCAGQSLAIMSKDTGSGQQGSVSSAG